MLSLPTTRETGSSIVQYVLMLGLVVGVLAILACIALSTLQSAGVETVGDGLRIFVAVSGG